MRMQITPEEWRTLTKAYLIGLAWVGLVCLVRLIHFLATR
jgi:hypothetical protein